MKRYLIALAVFVGLLWLTMSCLDSPQDVQFSAQRAGDAIQKQTVTVACTGSAGEAVGSGTTTLVEDAYIEAIYLNYGSGVAASTDVTVSYYSPAWGNIMVRADTSTDALFFPRNTGHDSTGTAFGDDGLCYWMVDGTLKFNVSQSTSSTTALIATVYFYRP